MVIVNTLSFQIQMADIQLVQMQAPQRTESGIVWWRTPVSKRHLCFQGNGMGSQRRRMSFESPPHCTEVRHSFILCYTLFWYVPLGLRQNRFNKLTQTSYFLEQTISHLFCPIFFSFFRCEVPCERDCSVSLWSPWGPCLPAKACPVSDSEPMPLKGKQSRALSITLFSIVKNVELHTSEICRYSFGRR